MAKDKIKLDKRNYRLHSDENKDLINKSLSELGAGRSILIDNDNSVIAGNGVYEQAEKLGIKTKIIETDGTELIVVKRTDLSPDDIKRRELALADNSTGDTSIFDEELLMEDWTIDELEDWGVQLADSNKIEISGEEIEIGQEIEFAKELHIGKEYLVIIFEDDDEFNDAKIELNLQRQMEKVSDKLELNNTGTERVLLYSDFKNRIYENSDTVNG